jgi:hypothetical protein
LYTIEGTTGWKRHSTDGYSLTGLASIQALETTLAQFASLNAEVVAGQSGQNLYTLEFYDYFRHDYWQVVPCGPQIIRQSRSRPLFVDYLIRLCGVQNLSSSLTLDDPLGNLLSTSANSISSQMTSFGNDVSNNYGDVTIEDINIQ